MTALYRADRLDSLRPYAVDFIRIYLGLGLLARGALFLVNPQPVVELIQGSEHWLGPLALTRVVAGLHLVGGLLLALGLFTRLAAWAQIPPVFGAVVFLHWHDGLFMRGQSLEFSTLVLALLFLFGAFGSGPLSLDRRLARSSAVEPRDGGERLPANP